jgi:hypothetical protein
LPYQFEFVEENQKIVTGALSFMSSNVTVTIAVLDFGFRPTSYAMTENSYDMNWKISLFLIFI